MPRPLLAAALFAPLAACAVVSDGPLMDPGDALPLVPGLDTILIAAPPDETPEPLGFRTLPDGITLLIYDPAEPPASAAEDIGVTFHPLPGHDGVLVTQTTLFRGDQPFHDQYAYAPVGCGPDGRMIFYEFDIDDLDGLADIPGLTVESSSITDDTLHADRAEAVFAVLALGLADEGAGYVDLGAEITCAAFFGPDHP